MAVNTTFTRVNPSIYPVGVALANVGTTFQAFAPPTDDGRFEWLISGSAALYFCEGSAADDGGTVSSYPRHAMAAETPFTLAITPEVGKRAHLLIAAQTGTITANVQLKRVSS